MVVDYSWFLRHKLQTVNKYRYERIVTASFDECAAVKATSHVIYIYDSHRTDQLLLLQMTSAYLEVVIRKGYYV